MRTLFLVPKMGTRAVLLTLLALLLCLPSTSALSAQGGGASSSGGGNTDTPGDQDRDRDRLQDPTTHDGDEPLQDRDRDRIGTNATGSGGSTGGSSGGGDQDRDRDRLQDPTTHDGDEPLQDRDRDKIRVSSPAELEALISDTDKQYREREQSLEEGEVRAFARNHNRVRVATLAFMAVENMVGPNGPQMVDTAQEVSGAVENMEQVEEMLQNQSRFSRFFFGSNDENVASLEGELNQNRVRIEKLNQYLGDCTCDEETRAVLREQLRIMEEEQVRLGTFMDAKKQERGIFGILFGWL